MSRKPPVETVHEAVKVMDVHLRLARMSLQELADKAGVSRATIHGWRSGTYTPTLLSLEACLQVLGLRLKVTYLPEKENRNANE